jgi:ATP-binding cassette, subfamily B, bacterial
VPDRRGAVMAPRFRGRIEFEDVDFSYGPDQEILKNINLTIEPRQVAALVGPSGAGKTTLVGLIARFYDPERGAVRIDGKDIRTFRQRSLRQRISFVLQDTLLFHTTVWQNIAYGRPEAHRDDIMRAAKLANAHEFIEQMPKGYDTIVGERGATLSGGQRQRIAIARAIVRDAPILILDEPSSGLDANSEQLVFEALERLMQKKTCVVIAHRLATIQRADVIFVLNEGTIVEQGKHEDLLARGGLYAELYETQFRSDETKVGV